MIRKIIIVALTLAAVGVLGLRLSDLRRNLRWTTYDAYPDLPAVVIAMNGRGFSSLVTTWMIREGDHPSDGLWLRGPFLASWGASDECGRYMVAIGGPWWFAFLTLLAYPSYAFIRSPLLRSRRRRRGLCVKCGYDLRGSPGRCPECATEIESP